MKEITRDSAGITQLIAAWQKARSNAAEADYLDLLGPHHGLPGLDWAVGDERTLDMLLAYESGERPLDDNNWMNLCWVVRLSTGWSTCLAFRGWVMPDYLPSDKVPT